MQTKSTQLIWFILLALVVSTSACNQDFFKPDNSDSASVIITQAKSETTTTPVTAAETSVVVNVPINAKIEQVENTEQVIANNPALLKDHNPVNDIPSFEAADQTNLWHRIKDGMQLSGNETDTQVSAQIQSYASYQDYLDRVTDRAQPFLFMIMEQIDARKMPAEIALLPIVESAFEPFAYSHGRAAGIWQFIPGTGRMYGLKQDWWYDGRRDIVASTHAALDYLEALHKRLDGDWLLALAAYNSGEGNVRRAMRKNIKKGLPTDFWHLDLPDETRAYIPKLLAISAIVANPQQYNITLKPILNEPRVVEVETPTQIDLALVAQLADISIEEVYQLNPAFNHWATAPDEQRKLLIPVEKESIFHERLAKTPQDQFIQWKRHKIKSGETLSEIAQHYRTTVKLLTQVNHISNNQIRQGKHLLIPVAKQSLSNYTLTQKQRSLSRLASNNPGQKIILTVADGDTFWDLSRKHKISVNTLARWNGMAPADTLKPGKQLVLWKKQGKQSRNNSNPVIGQLPAATIRTIHYTVRQGDSLALISSKFNVTVKQLRQWNQLSKDKYLQPGQRLKLLVDVTRQT